MLATCDGALGCVWDVCMGFANPMTTTAVPFYYRVAQLVLQRQVLQ